MASAEPQRTEMLKCTIESFQKLKSFSHKLRCRKLSQTITSKTNQRLPYVKPIVAYELKRSVFHKKQQQQQQKLKNKNKKKIQLQVITN